MIGLTCFMIYYQYCVTSGFSVSNLLDNKKKNKEEHVYS